MGLFSNRPFTKKASSSGRFAGISTIYGVEGDHETPYMTRVWIGRLRLHIFFRGDQDPDCHDHPWDFWTFPLTTYTEEVLHVQRDTVTEGDERLVRYFRTVETVKAFRWHFRPASHRHRVLEQPGKIVTLVWRSPEYRKWGFIKERGGRWCWVAWKKYVYEGGKDAPCAPPKF